MKKGNPCLLSDFASFFSNYVGYQFSKIFAMIFYPIFYKFNPPFGIFLGVEMRPMFTDFLCVKFHPL